ncbi:MULTISPECIES: rhomboid family intramembrane serine protease [Tenacibaculum]|uniref:Rhomboid family intramembrane serine protease n=2 Tax=Tenacibaculum TaxID=104267 RepID=A0AAE9MMP0_9FLAO|nr:rhomboid family intramembrane serine protease [Tenacibaculum mesophilum]GFD75418.1 rhomboid family intramembrane serine protease [Tenacibaculum sp. KUL113]AZJ32184.1 rhomboid family intramembrane serine protease [Tenacibaculum mesophilum]KAF9658289.1 rhomboid family intramembrane serine protease [Tenacibaculum mesophilum]QFS27440.1 rhomboid family intramembrane serine protease [Tenacibaculum mesophilum]UTD14859.1 rhomboid family intramembrane serine protease [Tenacibaculum mesophilum]
MPRLTQAIKHLIIINVIMYFAPQLLNMDLTNLFALHYPKNEHFGVWQYVTHIFMHGGPAHLLFNMYGLWAFGTPLEQMWGRNKFLFFYFSAGIGAGLIYTFVNYYQFNGIYEQLIGMGVSPAEIQNILSSGQYNDSLITLSNKTMSEFYSLYHTPAVGASGAIYGILVAFGLTYPDAKLALIFFPVPIAAKYFIPLIILSDLFFGMTSYSIGNIAHFAHIGGAIIGFIIAWYWKKNQFKFR